ncbi:MAG: hypothetical protein AAFN93_00935 [Bacteroidota bacterium]
MKKNKKKYLRYESYGQFLFLIFSSFLIFLIYRAGNYLQDLIEPQDNYAYYLQPADHLWMFPAFFLGFGLVIIPLEWLYKWMLKADYDFYIEALNKIHGYNGVKVAQLLCKGFIVFGTVFFALLLNTSLVIKEDRVIQNDFFDFIPSEYLMAEITEISYYTVPFSSDGEEWEEDVFTIYSLEGKIWSSADVFTSEQDHTHYNMMKYLAKKSNIAIIDRGFKAP